MVVVAAAVGFACSSWFRYSVLGYLLFCFIGLAAIATSNEIETRPAPRIHQDPRTVWVPRTRCDRLRIVAGKIGG